MTNHNIKQNPEVESYPDNIKSKMENLRSLILETACKLKHIQEIEETLKWSEPSYLVKKGSTIRIDWKSKNPDQYAIYFNCNTNLIETFKMIYKDLFKYEKNRAIIFDLEEELPKKELKTASKWL